MADDKLGARGVLAPDAAQRVLTRAAALDVDPAGALSFSQLSAIAAEAGISSMAMEQALREHTTAKEPVPTWVRACLLGVPDRVTALRFYWLFALGICVSPLAMRLHVTSLSGAFLALGFAGFCAGALWSTSRAIGWLDRHGWNRLP